MRVTRPVVLALLVLLLAVPGLPAAAAGRGPLACARTLDCSLDDIDRMPIPDRLTMVRAIEAGPVAALLPAGVDTGRWRNIEGILLMFRNHGLGARGSWVSYTDAGILEGLERGTGLATGRSTATGGNPGTALWAAYLTRLAAGGLRARSAHDRAWSLAEQASTDYGRRVAETAHGEHPTPTEDRFFALSQVYRLLLQNRPPLLDVLTSVGDLAGRGRGGQRENFYDWATDTTNADAGRTGAELLWNSARCDVPVAALDMVAVFQAYFDGLLPAYHGQISSV